MRFKQLLSQTELLWWLNACSKIILNRVTATPAEFNSAGVALSSFLTVLRGLRNSKKRGKNNCKF